MIDHFYERSLECLSGGRYHFMSYAGRTMSPSYLLGIHEFDDEMRSARYLV